MSPTLLRKLVTTLEDEDGTGEVGAKLVADYNGHLVATGPKRIYLLESTD